MTRTFLNFAAGALAIGHLTACGSPETAPSADSRSTAVPAANVAVPGTPVPNFPTPVPPVMPPVPAPTVNPATDPIAQRALDHARQQGTVRSGSPTVRLSRPVTPQELRTLGLGGWNFAPGCEPPMYLVILQGDFNVRPSMPVSLPPGATIPAAFVVYVYDLRLNDVVSTFGDPDGRLVRLALGDPSSPSVDRGSLPNPESPVQLPCAPTVVPGAPAPTPAATPLR
jgi:hypothetical protein